MNKATNFLLTIFVVGTTMIGTASAESSKCEAALEMRKEFCETSMAGDEGAPGACLGAQIAVWSFC
ncbi:hypothetical protein [Ochrobactrum sp. Marseille-Q0166]|uniref:hypothetical protein n=1 Tax=Ochrobactrum sp. Marseille-Q0166 TaxID=2761105 RepID=UPI0016551E83|nr:hypothetical protein [Ochrobactrum sp. Marseille-Q0166]MBC8717051.1 hypothetical protein [Ochrobactrum sp. Marseille-Q0166]